MKFPKSDIRSQISNLRLEPCLNRPGWRVARSADADSVAQTLAMHARMAKPDDARWVICGAFGFEDHALYLVPAGDPVEIARAFDVGTHDGARDHDYTLLVIRELHLRNPMIPFFADCAGFKCFFENPFDDAFLKFVDRTVVVGTAAMADQFGSHRSFLLDNGYLHLWWD